MRRPNRYHLLTILLPICKPLNPFQVRVTSQRRTGNPPTLVRHLREMYPTKSSSQQVVHGASLLARLNLSHRRHKKCRLRRVETSAKLKVNQVMTMGQKMMINQKKRKKISQHSRPRQLMWAICWR